MADAEQPPAETVEATPAAAAPAAEGTAAAAPAEGGAEGAPPGTGNAEEKKAEEKKETTEEKKVLSYGYDNMEAGHKALVNAIKECDEKGLREIIWAVPIQDRVEFLNQVCPDDKEGKSAIHICTDVEHTVMLEDLLDYGADPSALTFIRSTPLHYACAKNNKRGINLLIQYGADVQLENNEYQKCHQMVKDQLAMQNYLNLCIDKLKELLKEKRLIPCSRQERSYWRSLYDIMDVKQQGKIRIDEVSHLLNIPFEGQLEGPDGRHVVDWFKNLDIDKKGVLTFADFILASQTQLSSAGGAGKKGKKKK